MEAITGGIYGVLAEYCIPAGARNPWYCPSIGEYGTLLEKQGFWVVYAVHFDRPTLLEGGENGMKHWLDMFAGSFIAGFSQSEKDLLYKKIEDRLKPALYKDGNWIADYRRIRVMAVKYRKNKDNRHYHRADTDKDKRVKGILIIPLTRLSRTISFMPLFNGIFFRNNWHIKWCRRPDLNRYG
ncbi:MAG: hypothetical protein ACOY4I_18180 [Bacillota bacterium]